MEIKAQLEKVTQRIRTACEKSGREPESVRLVAVSKTIPTEGVRAAIDAGVDTLGENYIQEARQKFEALGTHPVSWHFIGHLQSNKAKYAVRMFDLIHSVDSIKLAREISKRAANLGKVQNILVQVNISMEATKSGATVKGTQDLLLALAEMDHIAVRGLMTMPPFFDHPERARPYFQALRNLSGDIEALNISTVSMDELSMGMTGDFEVAIEEGATLVRIGTAIFGERM